MAVKMFLSFASEDIDFVKELELLIYRNFHGKITPIISANIKIPGYELSNKIIGHINDCSLFLVLLTRNSISNPTVMNELGYAQALFRTGIIKFIIPVVERIINERGNDAPIQTGVFFNPSIESAKYFEDITKWNECINNVEVYLKSAYKIITQPEHQLLKSTAEKLSEYKYSWEAAQNYKESAKKLFSKGKIKEAITLYKKSVKEYTEAEYYWEAAQQLNTIGKIYKIQNNIKQAAFEFLERGKLLKERREDYSWEASKSYEHAARLFNSICHKDLAKECFEESIELLEHEDNDFDAERVRNQLEEMLKNSKCKTGK